MAESTERELGLADNLSRRHTILTRPLGLPLLFVLLLVLLPAAAGRPAPGDLLEASGGATLEAAQVTALTAKLFADHPNPRARFAVESFLLRYESVYPDGEPARIAAQVFLPVLAESRACPVYVFAPGSTGLTGACRPSREHTSAVPWGGYRAHVLAFAGQGLIAMLPDYMGQGDPGRTQPYYHAASEGRSLLDAARALRAFLAGRSDRAVAAPGAFLAGYSQGGHAAFAAADLRAQYAPELRLEGIVGYGPATGVEALFREYIVTAPMLVYAWSRIYGTERFDPARILAGRWLATLEDDVTRQCIRGIQVWYPKSVRQLYQPRFAAALQRGRLADEFPRIAALMARNSSGLSGHGLPALVCQGTDDVVVFPATQEAFVIALRKAGSRVRYLVYPRSRHDTRQIAFAEALEWIHRTGGTGPAEADR